MLKKTHFLILGILAFAFIAFFIFLLNSNSDSKSKETTLTQEDSKNNSESVSLNGQNNTDLPLKIRDGFEISIFASNIAEARDMVIDQMGNLWVSQTDLGQVTLISIEDKNIQNQQVIFEGLKNPHGLALDPENPFTIYIAEEDKIVRGTIYSEENLEKIADLPSEDGHYTRSLIFGEDGRLYVSIGSSCNACIEDQKYRASVISMNKDGSDIKIYADGLRNAVFLESHPETGEIWATEMGRDFLGDNTPPDEINILREGAHYGWPYCYGDKKIDTDFSNANKAQEMCENSVSPKIEIQAHSAPLGLEFIADNWSSEYEGDLLVAYHGSWNRSVPTGYKIVRFNFDKQGEIVERSDFITGWLQNGEVIGRPAGILQHENNVYISDDHAGNIYVVKPLNEQAGLNKECIVTGCSGNICAEEETASTCEFKPEYECYRKAKCELQKNGDCGWTLTEEYKKCIEDISKS